MPKVFRFRQNIILNTRRICKNVNQSLLIKRKSKVMPALKFRSVEMGLHTFLILTLDGSKWLASFPDHFIP
jgi:hypothetical protein